MSTQAKMSNVIEHMPTQFQLYVFRSRLLTSYELGYCGFVNRQPGRWADWLFAGHRQQKIVHNVQDEMAEFVLPLRMEIKDSLTRQGMQNIRGLN